MSETLDSDFSSSKAPQTYRVLARKYRPRSFADLVGQEPMVRTLTNAFDTGRIAQAWMLTGVRGVGKTTTARILARALNYETNEIHQPTIHMSEPGIHCQAIMEGRHVDVVEMDAASHTGIDDIREIIAQVRYRPVSARFKVYIIDEVHMLSNQAFNGLLKTLEEPPEHVKFVFATTEIRKVPITVLSRCQRFDLRRIESSKLIGHLSAIAEKEGVGIEEDALRLIARAAEGSARDALSLTDQAIAHGAGEITAQAVRDMLGLADRVRIIDLFEMVMRGNGTAALKEFRSQYAAGADPAVVLADLADFAHLVTTLRYVPEAAEDASLSPMEVERGLQFSRELSIRTLGQIWQMLLKALEETRNASAPKQAAEMALIRLAHAADLPSPDELLALVRAGGAGSLPAPPERNGDANRGGGGASATTERQMQAGASPVSPTAESGSGSAQATSRHTTSGLAGSGSGAVPHSRSGARLSLAPSAAEPQSRRVEQTVPAPDAPDVVIGTLEDLVALSEAKRDSLMGVWVRRYIRLVKIEPGRLEIVLTPEAPRSLVPDLTRRLHDWTARRWVVTVSNGEGAPTLDEVAAEKRALLLSQAAADPQVIAVMEAFPGARIVDVRIKTTASEPPKGIAAAEVNLVPGAEDFALDDDGDGAADPMPDDFVQPVDEDDDL